MLNLELVGQIQEVAEDLVTTRKIQHLVRNHHAIIFKGRALPVVVGEGMLVKVNTNIGVASTKDLKRELRKLRKVANVGYAPDTMMDHTIVTLRGKQFFEYMLEEFEGPVGTLPHYLAFHPKRGIDENQLLDVAEQQAEAGISFMTLHPTPTRSLYEKACRLRSIPTSSRGGGNVVRDMYMNNRRSNVIRRVFPRLLRILAKHNMAISIGSTFRPSNIMEALDEVHREEILLQGEYIRVAQEHNVPVQIEGIGHIPLSRIDEYFELISSYGVPMMPLGPLPTDAAIGQDHITNAIGAMYAGWTGKAHILNSITREEHTGGVPSEHSILEGVRSVRIAAHSVNISRFPRIAGIDHEVAALRAGSRTCVVEGGLFTRSARIQYSLGCSRCGPECPLRADKSLLENRDRRA